MNPTLTGITAENFRCFREVEARLAPLTILVGENGTGKTSFLALVRALVESAYGLRTPDFGEPPYDLGLFADIVHDRGSKNGRAKSFRGSFEARRDSRRFRAHEYRIAFEERAAFAAPSEHRYRSGDLRFTERSSHFVIETADGRWRGSRPGPGSFALEDRYRPPPWFVLNGLDPGLEDAAGSAVGFENARDGNGDGIADGIADRDGRPDAETLDEVSAMLRTFPKPRWVRPFCSAPVRTRPLRTYEPFQPTLDVEGDSIPTYLATLSARHPQEWETLRARIESFGRGAGLFDDFRIHHFGDTLGGPFRIELRKHSNRRIKGPWRNLADVGYGVSQVLPLLVQVHRSRGAPMFLLQEPEIHLHPSAEAALGSLLREVAASGRQVLVEAHSDHLMDRIRMDVRDGKTKLKPEEVSLLFFERGDREVNIHAIGFDSVGAVVGAPEGYRQFFSDELDRSINV